MLEEREMTVDDFLTLMARNKEIYPEFDSLPDENKRQLAQLNIDTGTAVSYFRDGELVATAGMRLIGIAEGWLVCNPSVRSDSKKSLLREVKKGIKKAQSQGVWRIFAETRISETFLKHLGFKKQDMYVLMETQK